MMMWIVVFAILLFTLVVVGLTMLFASRHGWIIALIRTGIIGLAVLISVPLTQAIARALSGGLLGDLLLSSASFDSISGDLPLLEESLQTVLGLLIAPLLFGLVFIIVRLLLSIIVMIFEHCIPALKTKRSYDLAIALPVGALNGLLIALVVLIPLCGMLHMGGQAVDAFLNESNIQSSDMHTVLEGDGVSAETLEATAAQVDNPLITAVATVGDPLYTWLTSATIDGGKVHIVLGDEISHVAKAAGDMMCVSAIMEGDFDGDAKELLTQAVDSLFASDWVAALGAEVMQGAANHWRDGKDFLDVSAPKVPVLVEPTMLVIYDILADETVDTVRSDLHTMAEVVGILATEGFMQEGVDPMELLTSLAKTGDEHDKNLYGQLLDAVSANKHLEPLALELKALTGRVVSSVFSQELRDNPRFDPVISDVAESLNKALALAGEEREEGVRKAMQQAFEAEGIVIPEELGQEMAQDVLDMYSDDDMIEEDEVREYVSNRVENDHDAILEIIESNDLSAFISSLESDEPIQFPY